MNISNIVAGKLPEVEIFMPSIHGLNQNELLFAKCSWGFKIKIKIASFFFSKQKTNISVALFSSFKITSTERAGISKTNPTKELELATFSLGAVRVSTQKV